MLEIALIVITAIPALVWLYVVLVIPWLARHIPELSALPESSLPLPRLSIVIAARNEAGEIEAALGTLLAQDYPDLEIIVIDDRSDDGTGDILRRMADTHARLHAIHIHGLPEGWLGKNHALQAGFSAAKSEYVLFTDADVHFAPRALRRALAHMQVQALDHLACAPRLINAKPSMRVMLPAFAVLFLQITRPWNVGDPRSRAHIGIGAFNLVRRTALQAVDGFERIRMRPDDDLMLAKLLKTNGHRAGFAMAGEDVSVEWYTSAAETIRGLEKNAFAQFEYSALRTLAALLLVLFLVFAPLAGMLLPGIAGALSMLASACMLGFAAMVAWRIGISWMWGLLFPLGALLVCYATWRSMRVTLRKNGITWRDTFYPLERLRENRLP
ncbi:MAG TPA: glycosyltransferase [Gammaproteobacteria bacterium]